MLSNHYRPGLCWARNCHILTPAAALFRSRTQPSDVGHERTRSGAPSSYPENMIRWTTKFLLLVLLAGTFAPMAAAYSMVSKPSDAPMPADHCNRKTAAPAMPGCHHQAAMAPAEAVRSPLALRSGICCEGHECCRSMVRSHSANITRRPVLAAVDRAEIYVAREQDSFLNRDFVASQSVRGPPAL